MRIHQEQLPTIPGTVIDVEMQDEDDVITWERFIRLDPTLDSRIRDDEVWLSLEDHDTWNLLGGESELTPISWQLVAVPVIETSGGTLIHVPTGRDLVGPIEYKPKHGDDPSAFLIVDDDTEAPPYVRTHRAGVMAVLFRDEES